MVTLVKQSLLEELFKGLHVLLINNFGEHTQGVGFHNRVLSVLDILGQARDNDEHFTLMNIKFLDEDINQSSQVNVVLSGHLENLGHIEEE